jgi:hypothetical protein
VLQYTITILPKALRELCLKEIAEVITDTLNIQMEQANDAKVRFIQDCTLRLNGGIPHD